MSEYRTITIIITIITETTSFLSSHYRPTQTDLAIQVLIDHVQVLRKGKRAGEETGEGGKVKGK